MRQVHKRRLAVGGLLLLAQVASGVTILQGTDGTGMVVPETISPIPNGFGSLSGFLVPDPSAQKVWNVSPSLTVASTYTVSSFADAKLVELNGDTGTEAVVGGLFISQDKYLTTGYFRYPNPPGGTAGLIWTYDSDGNRTEFLQGDTTNGLSLLSTPAIAPDTFGDFGGDLVVTDQNGFVFSVGLGTTRAVTELYDQNEMTDEALKFNPFGLAFAPKEFGDVAGKLLLGEVNDSRHDGFVNIFALSPDSKIPELFTSVPLLTDEQRGLRQMAFAPASFLSGQIPGLTMTDDLLFVSVSGSTQGRGTQGDVLAIDKNGKIVASLRTIDDLAKFDPRGLFFEGDTLLVSDASDPIVAAVAADFLPGRNGNVPEPATLALFGLGLAGIGAMRRRKRAA